MKRFFPELICAVAFAATISIARGSDSQQLSDDSQGFVDQIEEAREKKNEERKQKKIEDAKKREEELARLQANNAELDSKFKNAENNCEDLSKKLKKCEDAKRDAESKLEKIYGKSNGVEIEEVYDVISDVVERGKGINCLVRRYPRSELKDIRTFSLSKGDANTAHAINAYLKLTKSEPSSFEKYELYIKIGGSVALFLIGSVAGVCLKK